MKEKQNFRLSKEKLDLNLDKQISQITPNPLKEDCYFEKKEKICLSLPSSVLTSFKVWCSYNRFTMGKGLEVLLSFYNRNKKK